MKRETKIGLIGLGCFALLLGVALYFANATMQELVETHTYIGVLTSIEYEHGGWFHSISATVLHFRDGRTFRVDGHHVYEVGRNYLIRYEQFGNIIKVQEVRLNE